MLWRPGWRMRNQGKIRDKSEENEGKIRDKSGTNQGQESSQGLGESQMQSGIP